MKEPSAIADRFGENLRRCRRQLGLSQEELGRRASLHRTEVGMLENGQRTPRIDTPMKLAAAAEVSPTALLDGIEWAVTRLERPGSFWIADPGTDSWHRWEKAP